MSPCRKPPISSPSGSTSMSDGLLAAGSRAEAVLHLQPDDRQALTEMVEGLRTWMTGNALWAEEPARYTVRATRRPAPCSTSPHSSDAPTATAAQAPHRIPADHARRRRGCPMTDSGSPGSAVPRPHAPSPEHPGRSGLSRRGRGIRLPGSGTGLHPQQPAPRTPRPRFIHRTADPRVDSYDNGRSDQPGTGSAASPRPHLLPLARDPLKFLTPLPAHGDWSTSESAP